MRSVRQEIGHWKKRLEGSEVVWEKAILSKARSGDADAIQKVIQDCESRIAKIIDCRLGQVKVRDKEDLLQEVVVQILDGIQHEAFDFDTRGSFLRWLVLVVTRAIAAWLASETDGRQEDTNNVESQLALSVGSESEELLIEEEIRFLVGTVVTRLPESYREIVVLRYFNEFSLAQMAEILGMSEAAVSKRCRRAEAHLRTLISAMPEFRSYGYSG